MKKITLLFTILTASFGFSQNGGDTCGAAVAVTPGSFTQTGIFGTGAELGTGSGSAWFVYTPTEDANIVVSSCNGGSDTYLAIGTGTCGSLNLAGSNDDFCPTTEGGSAYASQVSIPVTAGTDYYIEWNNRWSSGPFNWSIEEIACTAPTVSIATNPIDFTNCPATLDVSLEVVDMGDASTLTIVAKDDDDNVLGNSVSATAVGIFTVTDIPVPQSSVTFSFLHDSDSDCDVALGPYVLSCPPENDLFADAIPLSDGDVVSGSTNYSTQDQPDAPDVATEEEDTGAANEGPHVWYSYTGNGTPDRITVSTCQDSFDTEIFVYTGTAGALICIDDGYDECGTITYSAETSFDSDGTTTYYIAIAGYCSFGSCDAGDYTLSVSSVLGVDDFQQDSFKYSPNPVDEVLTLNAQNNIDDVKVYNMLGQEVMRSQPQAFDSQLDMSKLQSGAYFVQVTIGTTTQTVRVIKQ